MVVGLFALAKVPEPLTTLQVPVAGATAALAAKVNDATGAQRFCGGPALATAAFRLKTLITTSSEVVLGTQGPLLMVQRRVVTPIGRPDTPVVGEAGLAMVAAPFTTVHWPVPGAVAAFAANVVEPVFPPMTVQIS